jgi:hypothetical protein
VTAAAALALVVPLLGGVLVAGHSHARDFISELGAAGTQWGAAVSFGGFLPTGLLTLAFLLVAAPLVGARAAGKVGYYLLACVGVAYVGAAFAPCDLGCPAVPTSARQLVHNLLGVLEYGGGGIGLLLYGGSRFRHGSDRVARVVLSAAGVLVLAAFVGMASPGLGTWHGLIQWLGEIALFGSLLLIGWRLARPADATSERR